MAKVFPLADVLDVKVNADMYRMAIGAVELVCGIVLAMIPGCIKDMANVVLLLVMVGAGYSHYAVGDDVDKMMPSVVCGALLAVRLLACKLTCSHGGGSMCRKTPAPRARDQHSKAE